MRSSGREPLRKSRRHAEAYDGGVLSSGVLIFALSKAVTVTIVNLVIWGVIFPALVTGLIALAIIRAIGERQDNEERKRHRRGA